MKYAIFAIVLAATLVVPHVFGFNQPYYDACGQTVPSYNETEKCLQELNQYRDMNKNATETMQKYYSQMQKTIAENTINADVNQSASLKASYPHMAKEMLASEIHHELDYQAYWNIMSKSLKEKAQNVMDVTRINIGESANVTMYNSSPDQTSQFLCPAWHVCELASIHTDLKMVPNATENIPAKPEFKAHPTGYISTNSTVTDWSSLEAWMESLNKTK